MVTASGCRPGRERRRESWALPPPAPRTQRWDLHLLSSPQQGINNAERWGPDVTAQRDRALRDHVAGEERPLLPIRSPLVSSVGTADCALLRCPF